MTTIDLIQTAVTDIQTLGVPYFNAETWNREAALLSQKNLRASLQGAKFPLVFLLLDITGENYDSNTGFITTSPVIYIFGKAEPNKTSLWRHANEFPALRTIRDNLYISLKNNGARFTDVNQPEIFFDNTQLNKLNSYANAIQITINDFNFYTKCN